MTGVIEPTDDTTEPDAGEPAIEPTKAELQDELRARDLPVSGNKDELIERLAEADAEDAEAADEADEEKAEAEAEVAEDEAEEDEESPAVAAGLVAAEDSATDRDRVAEYGAEAAELVTEVLGRLEAEVGDVLADFEAHHTDPADAAMIDAARAIRGHLADARRHLEALNAACRDLSTAASA